MASCIISESQKNMEQGALTNIEQAVKDNSQGALTAAQKEVMDSKLTDTGYCNSVLSLDRKLSADAKEATNVVEIPNIFDNGPGTAFLVVDDIWAKQAGE